jgi:hypothetical protein
MQIKKELSHEIPYGKILVAKFFVPDMGITSTMALGCRTDPPGLRIRLQWTIHVVYTYLVWIEKQ